MGKKAVIFILTAVILACGSSDAAEKKDAKRYDLSQGKMVEIPSSVTAVSSHNTVDPNLPVLPTAGSGSAMGSVSSEYTADVYDILGIAVIQPDPFSLDLTVSPDGTINFPYIGTVEAKGKTMMQIQETITKGLMEYMKYPVVTVSLKESHSRQFFVFGEVNRPGAYPLDKDTTVLKAITTAGGFTRIASMNNVKLLRQNDDGTTQNMTLDMNALMTGKTNKDEKVEPGDVITVSQRFF